MGKHFLAVSSFRGGQKVAAYTDERERKIAKASGKIIFKQTQLLSEFSHNYFATSTQKSMAKINYTSRIIENIWH
jgi:hypothetical protein